LEEERLDFSYGHIEGEFSYGHTSEKVTPKTAEEELGLITYSN